MVKLLLAFLVFETAFGFKGIETKQLWKAQLDHPTRATLCGESLWVWSRSKQTLNKVEAESGKIVATLNIKNGEVTAVACRQGEVVLAVQDHSSSKIFLLTSEGSIKTEKVLTAGGRLRDLSCRGKLCMLLRDSGVVASSDLSKWVSRESPLSPSVKDVGTDEKANPFARWQDYMLLAEGFYSRIAVVSTEHYFLLDPARNKVVSRNGVNFLKWGSWGAWEGYFLSPKAIAQTPRNRLIVADPGLKALFLYSHRGLYFGALTENRELLKLDYPFEVIAEKDRIYVTDVMGNSVHAYSWKEDSLPELVPEHFIRTNLFRRKDVLSDRNRDRCLKCHDGAVSDHWDKYFKSSHPIAMEIKHPVELPLEDGKVGCISCHDPHHGTRNDKSEKSFSNYLRAPPNTLCLECHTSNSKKDGNHPGKCLDCHSVHKGQQELLKQSDSQLCLKCHAQRDFRHRPVTLVTVLDEAAKLKLDHDKITCLTCHSAHHSKFSNDRERLTVPVVKLCQSCHGEKSATLYTNFHGRGRTKGGK